MNHAHDGLRRWLSKTHECKHVLSCCPFYCFTGRTCKIVVSLRPRYAPPLPVCLYTGERGIGRGSFRLYGLSPGRAGGAKDPNKISGFPPNPP